MKEFVSYIRVSTDRQGKSGLGLEAQTTDINRFLVAHQGILVGNFQDIETAKNDNREGFDAALACCRRTGATLLMAKIDRGSRNFPFLVQLISGDVPFESCDMPGADKAMKYMHGVFAELERERIASRTKAALQAKRDRGEKLGRPQNFTTYTRSLGPKALKEKSRNNPANINALKVITDGKKDKLTLDEIANRLNRYGFIGPRGGKWNKTSVSRLWNKSKK